MASTHFEPTYARYAFPCFDEPSWKTTFIVTLVRPTGDGYIALSNMPQMVSYIDTFVNRTEKVHHPALLIEY